MDKAEVGVIPDSTEIRQLSALVEFQHKCMQGVRGHPEALDVGRTPFGKLRIQSDASGMSLTLEASLA
jgi:hypothetical protein